MADLPTVLDYAKVASKVDREVTELTSALLGDVKHTDRQELMRGLTEIKQQISTSKTANKERVYSQISVDELKGVTDSDTLYNHLLNEAQVQGILKKKNDFKEILLERLATAKPEEIKQMVAEYYNRSAPLAEFGKQLGDADKAFSAANTGSFVAMLDKADPRNRMVIESATKDPSLIRMLAVAEVVQELKLVPSSEKVEAGELAKIKASLQKDKERVTLMIGDDEKMTGVSLQQGQLKLGGYLGAMVLLIKSEIAEALPMTAKEQQALKEQTTAKEAEEALKKIGGPAGKKGGAEALPDKEVIPTLKATHWDFAKFVGESATPSKDFKGAVCNFGHDLVWNLGELSNPRADTFKGKKTFTTAISLGDKPSDLMRSLHTGAAYKSPYFSPEKWGDVNLIYFYDYRVSNLTTSTQKKAAEDAFSKIINDFMKDKTRDALPICVAVREKMGTSYKPVILYLRKSDLEALNK